MNDFLVSSRASAINGASPIIIEFIIHLRSVESVDYQQYILPEDFFAGFATSTGARVPTKYPEGLLAETLVE